MATLFEPTLSGSAFGRSSVMLADAAAKEPPSMADSLPSINFGFDELRERMAKFTHRFDEFIANGRKRVLEERNAFKLNVAELQEDAVLKTRAIEILTQKSQAHAQTLAKEAAETAEMQTAISQIQTQRDARQAARDRVAAEILSTKKLIAAREQAQRAHEERLAAQRQFNSPELDFWVECLGLRIEGAGKEDRLKFVFECVDEREWGREVWFEICTERREYEVVGSRPRLEGKPQKEKMEAVLERLNETRDLGPFLKGMRALLVETLKIS